MTRIITFVISICVAVLSFIGSAQTTGVLPEGSSSANAEAEPTNVVERVRQSGSSVTVTAPEQLLLRAVAAPDDSEDATEELDEEGVSEDTSGQTVRAKGGKTVGFRVQVYADNNVRTAKTEARQRERRVNSSFPQWSTYVTYASPFWRLRVGDFRSQYDAEKAAAEIRKLFPRYAKEVRVVRDRVKVL